MAFYLACTEAARARPRPEGGLPASRGTASHTLGSTRVRPGAVLTRLRVVAYVTRGAELLVFDHQGDPASGTQVPAGRLDPGESLEEGLARELDEEVGIRAHVVRELGHVTRRQGDGNVYESHYFQLETGDRRDAWEHVVHGDGDDAGFVFLCRFVPLDPRPVLAGRQGEFLDRL
jgi:8-oxo-dGTP pyrophosphatase MutT (NUDIX family)